jgi:hypothetical protein
MWNTSFVEFSNCQDLTDALAPTDNITQNYRITDVENGYYFKGTCHAPSPPLPFPFLQNTLKHHTPQIKQKVNTTFTIKFVLTVSLTI